MSEEHTIPRLYYRLESPTQTPEIARQQELSGEIWGRPPQQSTIPAVQAYVGPLPSGARGVEFHTDTPQDPMCPPRVAYWRGPRKGVRVEDSFAKITVVVTKNTQI
jgi:hypothetical protein